MMQKQMTVVFAATLALLSGLEMTPPNLHMPMYEIPPKREVQQHHNFRNHYQDIACRSHLEQVSCFSIPIDTVSSSTR